MKFSLPRTLATLSSLSLIPNTVALTWGFPYGSQKVRGVNLGGWLVLEVRVGRDISRRIILIDSCSHGLPLLYSITQATQGSLTSGLLVNSRIMQLPYQSCKITGTRGLRRQILLPSLQLGSYLLQEQAIFSF